MLCCQVEDKEGQIRITVWLSDSQEKKIYLEEEDESQKKHKKGLNCVKIFFVFS